LDPESQDLARKITDHINGAVPTEYVEQLQNAAHSKMVVNLTNSLTTLIGHGFRPLDDKTLFQKILSQLTYEGVCILKAAGYKEHRLGGMPSWLLITLAAKLPLWATRRAFEKNIKKMVISSMAQDIIQRGATSSELSSLNGYFIDLAKKHGISAPYNEAVYELCLEHFKPGFKPLTLSQVWQRVMEKRAVSQGQLIGQGSARGAQPVPQATVGASQATARHPHHSQKA
jgi:ketopantoate reductase